MRTTPLLVGGLIEVEAGVDLDSFIAAANELVTEVCVPAGYGSTRLELIERYLSAHFYTNLHPRSDTEKIGEASVKYQGKTGFNFSSSFYGQTALALDTAGGLAAFGQILLKGKRRISVHWLGRDPCAVPSSSSTGASSGSSQAVEVILVVDTDAVLIGKIVGSYQVAYVLGRVEVGDGGGGQYIWQAALLTLEADDDRIRKPSYIDDADPGRWMRITSI